MDSSQDTAAGRSPVGGGRTRRGSAGGTSAGGAKEAIAAPSGVARAKPAPGGTGAGAAPASGGQDLAGSATGSAMTAAGQAATSGMPEGEAKDTADGAVQGAQIGSKMGGPHGAAIGAGVGATLGAGGTSKLMQGDVGGAAAEGFRKHGRKMGVAATGAAVQPALQLLLLMAFLNWLKSFFFTMLAILANLGKIVWLLIKMIVKMILHKIGAFFSGIGHSIASAFGLGKVAAAVISWGAGGGGAAGAAAIMLIAAQAGGLTAKTDGRLAAAVMQSQSCGSSDASCCAPGATPISVSTSGSEGANAKKIYTILKSWHMPDENIAGILGNWTKESNIDPTAVQGIYDEPYAYGPKKRAAINSGTKVGIGLGQWTGARNTMLQEYAKAEGKPWYDMGAQLTFLAVGDDPGRVAVFRGMIKKSRGTPAQAAAYWNKAWEGSADGGAGIAAREAAANTWFAAMSKWESDSPADPAPPTDPIVTPIDDPITVGDCGSGPGGTVQVPPGASAQAKAVLQAAAKYVGSPYCWGGGTQHGPTAGIGGGGYATNPDGLSLHCGPSWKDSAKYHHGLGFDCSGLTMYAYYTGTKGKISLTHPATGQYNQTSSYSVGGASMDPQDMEPGDLLFFGSGSFKHHVAMYWGDGKIIEAPKPGSFVHIVPFYRGDLSAVTRPLAK